MDEEYRESCPDGLFFKKCEWILKVRFTEEEEELLMAKYGADERNMIDLKKLRDVLKVE